MKTKNSDIAVKIFLVVVAVILVGLIIAWSTGVFKDKKNDLNEGTEKINNAISSMAEFDLMVYEGKGVSGDSIINLLNSVVDKNIDISVGVKTLAATSMVTYTSEKKYPAPAKTEPSYINPNGTFTGEIQRDPNKNITGINFTQY